MVLSDLDRHLITRCLSGADGAWEDFIDRYLALITHVVNATAKSRGEELSQQRRDDCIAEVLLNLVDKDFAILRRFRGQSSLGTYLVVVTRRIAVRTLARLGRPAVGNQTAREASRGDNHQSDVENSEEVRSLLQKLPGTEATAIRMFHLEHRSYGDIGAHIGIPENSVGPLLTQARQRMRSMRAE